MGFDLLVKNGKLVSSQGIKAGNLLVNDGKIAAVLCPGHDTSGIDVGKVVDVGGKLIFPGMVDLHVHIDDPGKANKEDVETGTKACAAGGVTTVVLMPTTVPAINSAERIVERGEALKRTSYVDFGLLGGAGGELPPGEIMAQAKAGAIGYKSYLRTYREDRKGLICGNTGDVHEVQKQVQETGLFIGYHAEDHWIINRNVERLKAAGRFDFRAFSESRPEFTESLTSLILMEVARQTRVRLFLVHMSSPRAIRQAHQWREEGTDVTVETCPHYMMFTEEDHARLGPYAQVAPPLRSPESVAQMWDLVEKNMIHTIGTDHAPDTHEVKLIGMKNIFEGGGGLPGLETVWPTLIDKANRGLTTMEKLAFLLAENPARVAQLYPEKGSLTAGADADLVVIDKDATYKLYEKDMYTKNQDSARIFDGMEVQGRVEMVFQRGHLISERGKVVIDKPLGARWMKP